jgi:hypothetical protein
MPFVKGQKKPVTTGDFKPGADPRRNTEGRPPNPDARISEIQAHMRHQLAETMYKLWLVGFDEVEKMVNSGKLSTGEMIAARFLHVTAKSGSYPHFQTILKVIGLNPPERLELNVTMSLEDLVASATKQIDPIAIEDKSNE